MMWDTSMRGFYRVGTPLRFWTVACAPPGRRSAPRGPAERLARPYRPVQQHVNSAVFARRGFTPLGGAQSLNYVQSLAAMQIDAGLARGTAICQSIRRPRVGPFIRDAATSYAKNDAACAVDDEPPRATRADARMTATTGETSQDLERHDHRLSDTGLLWIPIEGKPSTHNRLRADDAAFDAMTMYLPELRARDVDFGFVLVLNPDNVAELPWVAGFAADVGTKMLRVVVPMDTQRSIGAANVVRLGDCLRRRFGDRMAIQIATERDEALR